VKLVTWNCQGAFRKKYSRIARSTPDLAVIQECEHLDRLARKPLSPPPTNQLWFGESLARGLGIFSWTGLELTVAEGYDPSIHYCVPVRVSGAESFNLLAVWAMQHPDQRLSYIAQVNLAIIAYQDFICETNTILMGDFNSNPQHDPLATLGSHDWVIRSLADLDIVSAYHSFYQEKQGRESQATFFMNRKLEQAHHLDYIFIPRRWLKRVQKARIGDPAKWLAHSDHCPVFVEIGKAA
jgi:exodeoxyribonuclease III